MKHMIRRIGFLVFGSLALVVLLELSLQALALLVEGQTRHVEARWLTGHTRVLALGDSNTYGLYLEAEASWPMLLEKSWNARHVGNPVEVLNLGYPGTNSFRVRDNLPSLLATLEPDVVLVMVGFNDFWTPKEATSPVKQGSAGVWFRQHSRLYKAWVMWQRQRIVQSDLAFGSPRPSAKVDPVEFNDPANIDKHLLKMDGERYFMGVRDGEPARNMKSLEDNLGAMIALVRQQGAHVALMTYPSSWGFYPGASKWIRKAGEQNAVPVIELSPAFLERCPEGPAACPAWLFHDGHATAQGNALVATEVSAFLEKLLAGR